MNAFPLCGQIHIHAERSPYGRSVSLHLIQYGDNGQVAVAQPFIMTVVDEAALDSHMAPVATLPMQTAQDLIDELWRVGLRPTEGTGSAGSLAAAERHLADMRKLAFHVLKVAP